MIGGRGKNGGKNRLFTQHLLSHSKLQLKHENISLMKEDEAAGKDPTDEAIKMDKLTYIHKL